MKIIEIAGIAIAFVFGLSIIIYSYKIWGWNHKLKLLRLCPKQFYNQTVIYTDNEQFKHRVKLLFEFSDGTMSIEFINGDTKNVNISDLEPCKF